jgi:hypothetical protein
MVHLKTEENAIGCHYIRPGVRRDEYSSVRISCVFKKIPLVYNGKLKFFHETFSIFEAALLRVEYHA